MCTVATLFGEELLLKKCTDCGEDKPYTEFPARHSLKRLGLSLDDPTVERRNQCKDCMKKKNRDRSKARKNQTKPEADYCCPICDKPQDQMTKHGLVLDHDHVTGLFRGWICDKCNTGLERFNDDPEIMRRAAEYLEKFNSTIDGNVNDHERETRESHRTSEGEASRGGQIVA